MTTEIIEEGKPQSIVELIETVIASLAQADTAMVSQDEGGASGYLWKFKYGTVEIYVKLTGLTDDDTLTVWSTILKLPAKNELQLTKKLLEMNWAQTFEARFAISDSQIVVVTARTMAEISPGEVSRAITVVATIADEQDELLIAEFGLA